MNVQEIITAAQNQADEVYDNPTWITYINQALDDLTTVAKLLKQEVVTGLVVANGRTSVPLTGGGANANLAAAQEILNLYVEPTTPVGDESQYRRLPTSDRISPGWIRNMDAISIQGIPGIGSPPVAVTEATVTVDYYKKIAHVSGIADIPEIPSQYHGLIVLYCCAKSQQKEEELGDKRDFMQEYQAGKNDFSLDRTWEMEPHMRKHIKKARIAAKIGIGVTQQQ